MSQLSFTWPASVSLGAEDFFVSEANRAAHHTVTHPGEWPLGKLVLVGPEAAGKSHLARVLAAQIGAAVIQARDITPDRPLPAPAPTIVEDADQLPRAAEPWLFHLHNSLAGRAPLLLSAQSAPTRWPVALPDLASRMQGTALAHIGPPDDALLIAVLTKHFADRQITPEPELPAYLALRLERSFAALAQAAEALDRLSMQTGRPVGRRLASQWLSGKISVTLG